MSFKTQRKQLGIMQQDHTALPRLIAQILKPCMNMQLTCHVNPLIWWEPCMRSTSQFWNSAEVCFTANSKQILGGEHFCTGAFHRVVATPPQISGRIFFLGWDPAPVDTSINVLNELKTLVSSFNHLESCFHGVWLLWHPGTKNTIAKGSITHVLVLPLLAEYNREGPAQLIP